MCELNLVVVVDLFSITNFKFQLNQIPFQFPNPDVYQAYMKPDVNSSNQTFKWQPIQYDDLHDFLYSKIGWNSEDLRLYTYQGLDRWNQFVQQEYGS